MWSYQKGGHAVLWSYQLLSNALGQIGVESSMRSKDEVSNRSLRDVVNLSDQSIVPGKQRDMYMGDMTSKGRCQIQYPTVSFDLPGRGVSSVRCSGLLDGRCSGPASFSSLDIYLICKSLYRYQCKSNQPDETKTKYKTSEPRASAACILRYAVTQ